MANPARFERATSTFAESRSYSAELRVLECLAETEGLEPSQDCSRLFEPSSAATVSPRLQFWRRVRDSNSQAHLARQFSGLRPYQLGLTLRKIIWQERQDLNPHELVWNQSGYPYLTLLHVDLMHGEGFEPPSALQENSSSTGWRIQPDSATRAKFWYSKKQEGTRIACRLLVFRYTSGAHFSEGSLTQGLAKVRESHQPQ